GRIVHTVRRCFLLLSECSRYRSIWPFALKRLTILQFVGCLSVDSGFLRPRQTQNPLPPVPQPVLSAVERGRSTSCGGMIAACQRPDWSFCCRPFWSVLLEPFALRGGVKPRDVLEQFGTLPRSQHLCDLYDGTHQLGGCRVHQLHFRLAKCL